MIIPPLAYIYNSDERIVIGKHLQTRISALRQAENDIEGLSKLLTYGREKGFDSFINRKLIWPFLLGLDSTQLSGSIYDWDGEMDKNSTDYEQLQKDAERSLASMKTFDNITKFHLYSSHNEGRRGSEMFSTSWTVSSQSIRN